MHKHPMYFDAGQDERTAKGGFKDSKTASRQHCIYEGQPVFASIKSVDQTPLCSLDGSGIATQTVVYL